jgi:hypothetical protein
MRAPAAETIVAVTREEEAMMRSDLKARAGDRLVIHAHRLGEHERDAEILETLGTEGGPPFRVRWSDSGEETLHFPGSDATVERLTRRAKAVR